jgi:hypothetical protein
MRHGWLIAGLLVAGRSAAPAPAADTPGPTVQLAASRAGIYDGLYTGSMVSMRPASNRSVSLTGRCGGPQFRGEFTQYGNRSRTGADHGERCIYAAALRREAS